MRINVEFAHSPLDSVNWTVVERSCLLAEGLVGLLRQRGHEVSTSVLIDDKRVLPKERDQLAKAFLTRLEGPVISYYCHERDLAEYAEDLVKMLSGRKRRALARDIRMYNDKFGTQPCSVDISIWHLLRLGLMSDVRDHIRWLDGEPKALAADMVVSILGDQTLEYEHLARRNILGHVADDHLDTRIANIYYPETLSDGAVSLSIRDFIPPEIKEVLHVENPDH